MKRLCCLALTIVVALASGTTAQQSSNTARLSGVVMNRDGAPQPVRRAVVSLRGGTIDGLSVITDDQGRFEFVGLPAGRFTVTASKPAYLTNAYGAKAPGRPGTPVSLAAGQSLTGMTLQLPRGASISGTVRDFTGDPAAQISVFAIRLEDAEAGRQIPNDSATTTDDRGSYRAYGLAPGTYIIAAAALRFGLATETTARHAEEIDELMRQQQLQQRTAVAPGRGMSPAPAPPPTTPAPGQSGAPPAKPRAVAYSPIFYPGTPIWSQATRLTLRAGEGQEGIDFALDLLPVTSVEGVVVSPTAELPEMNVALQRDGPTFAGFAMTASLSERPGGTRGNAFKLTNVTAGHYTITARTANTQTTYAPNGGMTMRSVPPGTLPALWAQAEIDVLASDLTGVTLQLQPAATLSGRIAFETTTMTVPEDLTKVRINAASPTGGQLLVTSTMNGAPTGFATVPISATAKTDGTFDLFGLSPGRYTLSATLAGAPPGWWLASAIVDGRDAIDTPIDVAPGRNLSGAVLTFSDRHASLTGSLKTAAGQPALDYFVVVFPADRALWRPGARRIKSAKPASDGQFSFADLPPGAYLLATVTDATSDDWQQPGFLADLAAAAVPVTIAPGEKKIQSLQISGSPDRASR